MIDKDIEKKIIESDDEKYDKVDWTKAWGKKYPVLVTYQNEVNVIEYSKEIRKMLDKLSHDYNYNELDSMLVLKDILAHEYLDRKNR